MKEINKLNEHLENEYESNVIIIMKAFERNVIEHCADDIFFNKYIELLNEKYGIIFTGTKNDRVDFVLSHISKRSKEQ